MRDLSSIKSTFFSVFIGWHLLAMGLALVIGGSSGEYNLFLSLLIWTAVATLAYWLEPPYYVLSALVLSAIEELIVYSFGGGLQGRATSLVHDYLNSLPIFLSIILVWRFILGRYNVTEEEVYALSIAPAMFIELLFQGILLNPILLFLLGGPVFFIYGSIMSSPKLPRGDREFTTRAKIFTVLLMVVAILAMAIVMTDVNNALGYGT